MPAEPAITQLCGELDELGATLDAAIADGRITEEERTRITDRFWIVSFRAVRINSGNRMLRLLANTGEITPKAERLFRELTEDQARAPSGHSNVIAFPGDGDDDGAPNVKAA